MGKDGVTDNIVKARIDGRFGGKRRRKSVCKEGLLCHNRHVQQGTVSIFWRQSWYNDAHFSKIMKQHFAIFVLMALLGSMAAQSRAAVVVSNLDPANTAFGFNAPEIGQAMLTGSRPISLTSVMFLQTAGTTAGESVAVYSRNADGTLGTSLFTGFTVGFDSTSDVMTATVSGPFTLQANAGYYFVLNSNSTANLEWSYTNSTDYASAFGATLPASGDSSFDKIGTTTAYYTLAAGPQEFQVNGTALAAVPEPTTLAFIGLAMVVGVMVAGRRFRLAV